MFILLRFAACLICCCGGGNCTFNKSIIRFKAKIKEEVHLRRAGVNGSGSESHVGFCDQTCCCVQLRHAANNT